MNKLPARLDGYGKQAGIAVYRALKQARDIIAGLAAEANEVDSDRIDATLDDLDEMLRRVE